MIGFLDAFQEQRFEEVGEGTVFPFRPILRDLKRFRREREAYPADFYFSIFILTHASKLQRLYSMSTAK